MTRHDISMAISAFTTCVARAFLSSENTARECLSRYKHEKDSMLLPEAPLSEHDQALLRELDEIFQRALMRVHEQRLNPESDSLN